MNPAVLQIGHDDEFKMVGKCFEAHDRLIWLHEESGTQSLTKYDGPGLDTLAVYWCLARGVEEYHHRIGKHSDEVRVIALEAVPRKGKRRHFGGRDRLVVPWDSFHIAPLGYEIPWIQKTIVIEPDDVVIPVEATTARKAKAEPTVMQLSLLEDGR